MLKNVLAASAAVAALVALSAPTYATAVPTGTAQSVVTVTGSVTSQCSLNGNPSSYTVALGNLADSNDNTAQVSQSVNYLTGAWCNSAGSTLSVATTPLTPTTAVTAASGFISRVDYTLASTSGVLSGKSFDTATGSGGSMVVGAFVDNGDSGTITTDKQTTNKLLAASYQGTVTVTLTPGS